MNLWFSVGILLWSLSLLYQPNDSSCQEKNECENGKIKTYRSALERSLQGVMGLAGFFIRPIMHDSNDNNESTGTLRTSRFGNVLNKFKDRIHAIIPGTRWCGDGNVAYNDTDIGIFSHTDACCRDHDKCSFSISAGQTYANLCNNGLFTRSSCECDDAFYDCLKNAHNPLATKIGHMYFTILGPQCIYYYHPISTCKVYGGNRLMMRKCMAYEYDRTKPMEFQWNDNADF